MNPPIVNIDVELSETQALALAQFIKRIGWSELRANAVDDNEAQAMREACERLQMALAKVGWAPR